MKITSLQGVAVTTLAKVCASHIITSCLWDFHTNRYIEIQTIIGSAVEPHVDQPMAGGLRGVGAPPPHTVQKGGQNPSTFKGYLLLQIALFYKAVSIFTVCVLFSVLQNPLVAFLTWIHTDTLQGVRHNIHHPLYKCCFCPCQRYKGSLDPRGSWTSEIRVYTNRWQEKTSS